MTSIHDFPEPGSAEWYRRRDERAAEQERRHAADPQHEPLYLPADDEEFPDESGPGGWEDHPDGYWPARYDD